MDGRFSVSWFSLSFFGFPDHHHNRHPIISFAYPIVVWSNTALGTPIKAPEAEVGFTLGLQNETVGTGFEEYLVNITKPLGIAVEEAADGSGMVYIADVGEKAEEAGLEVGDVIIGCSFIFDDSYLVNVTGKGVERVESLIRSRGPDYVCLRLRKGCEYHLMDPDEADAKRREEEDDEEGLEPEEKEARWIRIAQSIFVDDLGWEQALDEEEETW